MSTIVTEYPVKKTPRTKIQRLLAGGEKTTQQKAKEFWDQFDKRQAQLKKEIERDHKRQAIADAKKTAREIINEKKALRRKFDKLLDKVVDNPRDTRNAILLADLVYSALLREMHEVQEQIDHVRKTTGSFFFFPKPYQGWTTMPTSDPPWPARPQPPTPGHIPEGFKPERPPKKKASSGTKKSHHKGKY